MQEHTYTRCTNVCFWLTKKNLCIMVIHLRVELHWLHYMYVLIHAQKKENKWEINELIRFIYSVAELQYWLLCVLMIAKNKSALMLNYTGYTVCWWFKKENQRVIHSIGCSACSCNNWVLLVKLYIDD